MNIQRPTLPFGSRVIEPGSEFVRLIYNHASNSLVAQFSRPTDSGVQVHDLYYRQASSADYARVHKDDQFKTYCDPVSSRKVPYVFFNVRQWDKAGVGSSWVSVCRLSLPDGALATLLDRTSLKLPGGCIRGWVGSLLEVNDEGTVLTCEVALEFETQPDSGRVEYAVRDLDLTTGDHRPLAKLPAVFV